MEEAGKQGNQRDQLMKIATQYKKSWIVLGEHLTKVASEELYYEWGYKSFEVYCKNELGLKKSTAIRLTNAYFFITKEEPDLAESGLEINVISALQRAKRNEDFNSDMFEDLKKLAVEKSRCASTINLKFRKMKKNSIPDNQAFHKTNLELAKRLQNRIKPVSTIPDKYRETIGEMVSYFDAEAHNLETES